MRFAFAGDRKIAVTLLEWLMSMDYKPLALLITEPEKNSHGEELKAISNLPAEQILEGKEFLENYEFLKSLDLDYIFGIHFPYIIPSKFIQLPKIGFLNLHPAFLPFNKGWHTPSWAILDNTPFGATLHFMSEALDEGEIIHQKQIDVRPEDTADSLYQRVMEVEVEVFKEALPELISLKPSSIQQNGEGTSYRKKDLGQIQEIFLDENYSGKNLINKIRGLTTNKIEEAAYFKKNGIKYYLQLTITEEKDLKKI